MTFFVIKHDYIFNKDWQYEGTLFRFKKKLVVLKWTNTNLDKAMLKIFYFQISVINYRQQPLFLHLALVSVTVLHEKKFSSTYNLWYLRCQVYDLNHVYWWQSLLFLFVILIIQSRDGMQSSGVTESIVKKMWQNNWKMLQNKKMVRRTKVLKIGLMQKSWQFWWKFDESVNI